MNRLRHDARAKLRERCMIVALAVAPTLACYGPNPAYLGRGSESTTTSGTSETSTTNTGTSETSDSNATGEARDTTGTTGSTDTSDTSTETGTPDPACGDGSPDPGEFCFEYTELSITQDVQALAAGDFNDDGKLDLLVTRQDDLLVLFGDGQGSFPLEVSLPAVNGNYWGAAAGDLDGDSVDDLVVANDSTDGLFVYRSLGTGSFADALSFAAGDQPRRMHLAHLDDDLNLDAVVTLAGDDAVAVLRGDGSGGFVAPVISSTGGQQPFELGLGRFDPGDSLDLAVGNFNTNTIAILHNLGEGQFAPPLVHALSDRPRSAQVADFDLDGSPDVAAALEAADLIEILHGDGAGDLLGPALTLVVGGKPMGTLAIDLDNDLAPDLLVINRDDQSVGALFNNADAPGEFVMHQNLVGFGDFVDMSTIISADLNGDAVLDVVIGGDGVRTMLSNP